ncbi:hypothetical protein [Yersinia mollaretii]|uniref:hypothetical protein n=1 Tax=Yersinia mollaretii TaxID=33060 RepID=UPI0005E6AB4D|nr:hypothetical protein [Yersinia mollaretii]PJE87634.1 hypothetical protein CU280_11410 [Yersinia mollaretii]CQD39667.1 Uncharacterised protein [Yersinia mollaretii]CQH10443.1 Uncharacterised protein [Yersinia mollaretii]
MENIKRYNFCEKTDYPIFAEVPPTESPVGKYVAYSDYMVVVEQNKKLKKKIESLLVANKQI